MTAPIFKMPKVRFKNTKERKAFILDMIFVNVALGVLYVAVNEDYKDGVKPLHKNKNRKEVKKIKETYELFVEKRDFIYEMMEYKDIKTLKYKVSCTFQSFIIPIAQSGKDLNLETLAISLLRFGLSRDRKTEIDERLKVFRNFRTHKKIVNLVKNVIREEMSEEKKVAFEIANKIRY